MKLFLKKRRLRKKLQKLRQSQKVHLKLLKKRLMKRKEVLLLRKLLLKRLLLKKALQKRHQSTHLNLFFLDVQKNLKHLLKMKLIQKMTLILLLKNLQFQNTMIYHIDIIKLQLKYQLKLLLSYLYIGIFLMKIELNFQTNMEMDSLMILSLFY